MAPHPAARPPHPVPRAAVSRRTLFATAAALALPAPPSARAASALDDAGFLALSRAATGHADLDPATGARLFAAMRAADPAFGDRAAALAALVRPGLDPEALLAAAGREGLRDAALALVAAWYTGTVGDGPGGAVVAYADALMYRPVLDVAPVPTYCTRGPLAWTGEPPTLGVALPAPAPADGGG